MSPRSGKSARSKVARKGRKVRATVVPRLGERIPWQERERRNGETMKNAADVATVVVAETGRCVGTRTRQSLDPEALGSAQVPRRMEKLQRRKIILVKNAADTAIKSIENKISALSSPVSADSSLNDSPKRIKKKQGTKYNVRLQKKFVNNAQLTEDNIDIPSSPSYPLSKSPTLSENSSCDQGNIHPAEFSPTDYRPVVNATHAPLETLKNALQGYDHSRIYLAHVCFLAWQDLPGRRAVTDERVWVVGAADHGGRHRTRLLVAGRHWRPKCLSKVNMVTQPVVYAGGGSGSLTADLFLWWFHREFATTAMAMHPDGAILVAESADYLPPEIECVTADGLVRLFIVPKDCLEPKIVAKELRIRLAIGLLTSIRFGIHDKFKNNLNECIKKFTLKEAFAELHRAWLSIRSETFSRSWMLMNDRDTAGAQPTGLTLSTRTYRVIDCTEDHLMISELRELVREVGLNVDESQIEKWILDEESELAKWVKKKEFDEEEIDEEEYTATVDNETELTSKDHNNDVADEDEEEEDPPTAEQTVQLLSRVLLWMEREPLDPGLLLAVRSMRDTATVMVSKLRMMNVYASAH